MTATLWCIKRIFILPHPAGGGNYQSLINEALRAHISEKEGTLERTLRRVIREELNAA